MTKPEWQTWPEEPWYYDDDALVRDGANVPVDMLGWAEPFEPVGYEQAYASRDRIVACVNALAGIPDPTEWRAAVGGAVQDTTLCLFDTGCLLERVALILRDADLLSPNLDDEFTRLAGVTLKAEAALARLYAAEGE